AVRTDSALPRFLQVARAIVEDVRRGRLQPGDALPGSRALARELGLNRNTIMAAYAELQAEGWVETEAAGGTYISSQLPLRHVRAPDGPSAHRVGFALASPLPFERPPGYRPGTLVLAKGAPDVR